MPNGVSPARPRQAVKMGRALEEPSEKQGVGTGDSLATWRSAKPSGLQPFPPLPVARAQALVSYSSAILSSPSGRLTLTQTPLLFPGDTPAVTA